MEVFIVREFKRTKMKREIGSNRIGKRWRAAQIKKYGFKAWLTMVKKCCKARHRVFEA